MFNESESSETNEYDYLIEIWHWQISHLIWNVSTQDKIIKISIQRSTTIELIDGWVSFLVNKSMFEFAHLLRINPVEFGAAMHSSVMICLHSRRILVIVETNEHCRLCAISTNVKLIKMIINVRIELWCSELCSSGSYRNCGTWIPLYSNGMFLIYANALFHSNIGILRENWTDNHR